MLRELKHRGQGVINNKESAEKQQFEVREEQLRVKFSAYLRKGKHAHGKYDGKGLSFLEIMKKIFPLDSAFNGVAATLHYGGIRETYTFAKDTLKLAHTHLNDDLELTEQQLNNLINFIAKSNYILKPITETEKSRVLLWPKVTASVTPVSLQTSPSTVTTTTSIAIANTPAKK